MKGRATIYTAEELAFVQSVGSWPRAEGHAAFAARFGRQDVSLQNFTALCKRRGWLTGRTGHFTPGQEPPNKGKPFPIARDHPNCRKTQFRKGQEPHNTRFLGHERVTVDGYVEISVAETNPHTGYGRRYVLKHRWAWEQANGPLPPGTALKCLDGNKANTDPANWQPVARAMLPRLNGGRAKQYLPFDAAAPEVKPAVLAAAQLDHAARLARKRNKA